MRLYNGTGCFIHLIGTLHDIATITHNNEIVVNRKRLCAQRKVDEIENYQVIINHHDAQRILKFGFPGMVISVFGDLHTAKHTKIIAERIDFMNFPSDYQSQMILNTINLAEFKNFEKDYWFARNGLVREELTYIH